MAMDIVRVVLVHALQMAILVPLMAIAVQVIVMMTAMAMVMLDLVQRSAKVLQVQEQIAVIPIVEHTQGQVIILQKMLVIVGIGIVVVQLSTIIQDLLATVMKGLVVVVVLIATGLTMVGNRQCLPVGVMESILQFKVVLLTHVVVFFPPKQWGANE